MWQGSDCYYHCAQQTLRLCFLHKHELYIFFICHIPKVWCYSSTSSNTCQAVECIAGGYRKVQWGQNGSRHKIAGICVSHTDSNSSDIQQYQFKWKNDKASQLTWLVHETFSSASWQVWYLVVKKLITIDMANAAVSADSCHVTLMSIIALKINKGRWHDSSTYQSTIHAIACNAITPCADAFVS